MKRCDIDYHFTTIFGYVFRPSQRGAVGSVLYRHNQSLIRDVCKMTEEEFRRYAFATDPVMDRIKDMMTLYGLRFGMTEEELVAYEDAEFLEEHPEENEHVAEDDNQAIEIIAPQFIVDEVEDSTATEDTADHQDVEESEKTDFDFVMDKLRGVGCEVRDEIMGIIKEHAVLTTMKEVYINQPWWVKLFCSKRARMHKAIYETTLICGMPKYLAPRIVKYERDLADYAEKQDKEKTSQNNRAES